MSDLTKENGALSSTIDIESAIASLQSNTNNQTSNITSNKTSPIISSQSSVTHNLKNPIFNPLTCKLQYPHIALGSFARAFRDFIYYQVYQGFQGIIFGSYNRAIQSYIQRMKIDNTGDGLVDIGLPLFNYTIQIDNPDEKLDLPWRNTTYFPGVSRALFPSFYIDEDFELKVIYRRITGTINMNIYCSSEAEQLDIQMYMYDAFRGLNTYSSAQIRSMTVLPNNLLFIDLYGKRISKALTSNKIAKAFIPSINSTQYYIYNNISAILNMNSLSVNNNYYGGTGIPDFNLSGSLKFELDVPSYVLCLAKSKFVGIEINMFAEYQYQDDKVIKAIELITGKHMDSDVQTNSDNQVAYENGIMLDSIAYKVSEDSISSIPFAELFKDKMTDWHYKNRDVIVFLIYAGGVIRLPLDDNVAVYDEAGNIVFKYDLFNKEDLVQIYVFKLTKDLGI